MKLLLRIVVAIGVVIALEWALHDVYGAKQMQAIAGPQEIQVQQDQHPSPLHEEQSVHHPDLDNRADLLGVEQDIMRGATNFNDPGYRDLPNAAQMQFLQPAENDQRTADK